MLDLIVSVPDHCLSFYFSFASQTPIVQSYQGLPEGSHNLKERRYFNIEPSHLQKDERKTLYYQRVH